MAEHADDALIINEAKLILAEKRTSLATVRTGIAVLALPMTVVSFLVAFSERLRALDLSLLLGVLLVVCAGLGVLGIYLIVHSIKRLRWAEREMRRLRKEAPNLSEYM